MSTTPAPRIIDLSNIDVEDGVSATDGLPFCLVRAEALDGSVVMVGQLRPDEVRTMALDWLGAAEAAESDAGVAALLKQANPELDANQQNEMVGAALVFLRGRRAALAAQAAAKDAEAG